MKRIMTATVLALSLATPAWAGDRSQDSDSDQLAREMEQTARDAARQLMGMITLFINRIPVYEAPEVLENGDIIIRRKPAPGAEPPYPREKPRIGSRQEDVTDL